MVGFLEGKVVVLQDFGFPHGPRLGRGRSECLLIFIFDFLIYLKIDLLEIEWQIIHQTLQNETKNHPKSRREKGYPMGPWGKNRGRRGVPHGPVG